MKRMLIALMMTVVMLLTAFAFAEGAVSQDVIDRFSDTWVEDGFAAEVWYDEDAGAFRCHAVLGDGNAESEVWEYDSCTWDAEKDVLKCENGIHTHQVFDEATMSTQSDVLGEGQTATISIEEGKLHMSDGAGMNRTLVRLEEAEAKDGEEARAFVGRWGCDRATIDITQRTDDGFNVVITWGSSASEQAEWRYACAYDGIKKLLKSFEPGAKATVTYAENGEIASTTTEYEDGEASFSIDQDGMLIWNDAKENAGEGMRFERSALPEETAVNTLIENGSFIIQIPVDAGDEGWVADDMSQDDTIVKLYSGEVVKDTFVARYDAVSDGDVTVCVKHMKGVACDEAFTWDLRVANGAVQEVIGGSHTESPDEMEQDPFISGEWQVNDNIMAGMTIQKNEGDGWGLQIATVGPTGAYVLRANLFYDCELNKFVYEDGTFYQSEVTASPEIVIGDVVAEHVNGSLTVVKADDDSMQLEWYNAQAPEETARFYRPEGWGTNTIEPAFGGLELNDATYPVAFNRDNLKDGILEKVTLYTMDCYDIMDVQKMAVGDALFIENRTITIDTLEDVDSAKVINGGFEAEDGYTLRPFEEDNCWKSVGYDDFNTYTSRGEENLTLDENVIFTDSWDIQKAPATVTGIEAVTKAIMESENDSFDQFNTELRLEGGKVVEITRHYVP